ncbi:hypothetical protein ACFV2Q_30160 [Streptomyces sp. NPDC059650]|uniref:hypothetical protein n=1 Tax=Streptomyces sp. NPDC059650 TaxID=3346896 RepID=UPI0036C429A4
MRRLLTGITLATAVVVAVPAAAASAAPASAARDSGVRASASLRGWAQLDTHGPVADPNETLTMSVDAHVVSRPGDPQADPAKSWGHATVTHAFRENGKWKGTVRVEVSVDCLTLKGGSDAVLTGTAESVTYTVPPGGTRPHFPENWHPEVAFGFHRDDEGRRRIAWSGIPENQEVPPVATRCTTPAGNAPDLYLVRGGFTLK